MAGKGGAKVSSEKKSSLFLGEKESPSIPKCLANGGGKIYHEIKKR